MLIADQQELIRTVYTYYPKIDNKIFVNKIILYKYKCIKAFIGRGLLTTMRMQIERIFNSYCVIDWTDKREYDCIQFKILLHKHVPLLDDDIDLITCLGGTRQDLRIYISILGKYYFYNIEETAYDKKMNTWNVYNTECSSNHIKNKIDELEDFFQENNYRKVTMNQAQTIVPDLRLKYIEPGMVRIFDCLFTQIDGLL